MALRNKALLAGCTALIAFTLASPAAARPTQGSISIESKPLATALQELGRKTGANILFSPQAVSGRRSNPVRGADNAADAARQLVRGSNLSVTEDSNGALIIASATAPRPVRKIALAAAQDSSSQASNPAQMPAAVASDGSVMSSAASERPVDDNATVADSDEIIVSARQRDERLLDVPVAVSALSGAALDRRRLTTLTDIASAVPNLVIAKQASGSGISLSIRGVGSTFNDPGIDQTVLINVDGVTANRGFVSSVAFFDVAQVEVLKGPQALFFGRNSPAGVISIRSADPRDRFEGSIRAGYEFDARERFVEAMLSGPVTPTLGARLAVRYDKAAGFLRNLAKPIANPFEPQFPLPGGSGRVPGDETITGRLTLVWTPSSDLKATLKVLANHYTDEGLITAIQALRCASGTRPVIQGVADPFGDCKPDRRTSIGNMPVGLAALYPGSNGGKAFSNIDSVLTTLTLAYDNGGPISFTSITGYNYNDFLALGPSFEATVYDRLTARITERGKIFTQEFRARTSTGGPLNFAAGLYYEKSSRVPGLVARNFTVPVDPANGLAITYRRRANIDTTVYSGFGQAIWDISDTVELAGGARLTHEKKTTALQNVYVNPTQTSIYLPQGFVLRDRFASWNLSPEATLSWKPSRDLIIYAAYKTGYKAGGASVPTNLVASVSQIGFGPEKTKGGEIGFKGSVLDQRLTFSSAIYNYKISGLQLTRLENINGLILSVVSNAASARTRGAEFEGRFRASDMLVLRGSAAYNDAKITRFPGAPCYAAQTAATGCTVTAGIASQDRSGDPLSKAPKWSFAGGADIDVPVGGDLAIGASGDVKYSGSYRTQDDGAPYAAQSAFALFDASLRLHNVDDSWELALIGRNLTNKYYILTSSPRPGAPAGDLYGPIGRPRSVTVQGTMRF